MSPVLINISGSGIFDVYKYFEIFLITALLYLLGVVLYAYLIREHEQNQKKRLSRVLPIADELTID